jgi:uncharacterized membrane protein HdeD (DUF308 family)
VQGGVVLVMGSLAIVAPFFAGPLTFSLVGVLLIASGVLEMLQVFDSSESSARCNYMSGELSLLAGILLLSMPDLVVSAVAMLLAAMFLIDGITRGVSSLRAKMAGTPWTWLLATSLGDVALGLMLATRWPISHWALVAIVVGIRMLTIGWATVFIREAPPRVVEAPADQHPDLRLRLPPHPALVALNESLKTQEEAQESVSVYWAWTFVILFFAIHIGRMRVYWNLPGLLSPLAAVIGDLAVALVVAFAVVLPARMSWRRLTRPLERRGWNRMLAAMDQGHAPGLVDRLCRGWLVSRLRFARRLARMRSSPRAALRWAMQVGLPVTAVFIAIQPVWGFSWFFNSEAWASIVWHRWAEVRTDTWRENMVGALREQYHAKGIPDERLFRVDPPGVSGREDFTFLVLGDNGEGGAAQHSLRDQYLSLGKRADVKFLAIAADVIYPEGAMRDFEANFYLPFKGFTKPIYAIPGNHDWYDALEGFAANFLEADAARTCMLSRARTDGGLTTTIERRIEGYIREAARLRKEFGVSTGWQRGPFFEVQTERFALIAVDTGVLKTVDSAQWAWFKAALERSHGKFIMVILGHPLFTAGHYQGDPDHVVGEWSPAFRSPLSQGGETASLTAIHRLLREHQVPVVMAGDMHLFEFYQETYSAEGKTRTMHHFVNGGGGAYICVGVPFDWPKKTDASPWTYFPRKDAIIDKLDAQTPFWKMPLWLWVKHFSAWPFNGYIMSAAFDHNKAPYFQSFVEVQVLNSKDEVRFLPHSANGRMRWRELENYQALMPEGKTADDLVEFIVKMASR